MSSLVQDKPVSAEELFEETKKGGTVEASNLDPRFRGSPGPKIDGSADIVAGSSGVLPIRAAGDDEFVAEVGPAPLVNFKEMRE